MSYTSLRIGLVIALCALLGQCCPCCAPSLVSARLTATSAQVTLTPSGKSSQTVAVGAYENIGEGDSIGVDASGRALLEFPDLLKVEIYRDSTLQVRDASYVGTLPLVDLYLTLGAIFAGTKDPTTRLDLTVKTGAATIKSVATEFLVAANPHTNDTIVVVRAGTVRVTGAGQTVEVEAGQYTIVLPGQPPRPPEPFQPGVFEALVQGLRDGELTAPVLRRMLY